MGSLDCFRGLNFPRSQVIVLVAFLLNEEAHRWVGLFVFSTTTFAVEPLLKLRIT